MASKLPTAKQFKRWVTSEVIPAIRKHGGYLTPDKIEEVLSNPDTIIRLATELKEEQAKRKELEEQQKIEAQKVRFANSVCASSAAIYNAQLSIKLTKPDEGAHWISGYRGQLWRTTDGILTVTQRFRYDTTWAHMGGRFDYSLAFCGGTHLIRGGGPVNECTAKYSKMRFYELKLLDGLARGMTAKFAVFENSPLWDKVPGKGEYAYGRFEMHRNKKTGKEYLNLT